MAKVTEYSTDGQQDKEDIDALIELCESRSATYAFLSRLYRTEIDRDFLDVMHGMRYPAATGNEYADEGYYLIALHLSNIAPTTLVELAVDYSRTFIGNSPDGSGAAFPFESVYTSEKHLMMQDARDEVLAIYRAYGYDKDDSWREGEDHLAVELEFMQVTSTRIANAFRMGKQNAAQELLRVQGSFIHDHLLSWVPLFTSDMLCFSKTNLYSGLAKLTRGFLETEREFIDDILSEN